MNDFFDNFFSRDDFFRPYKTSGDNFSENVINFKPSLSLKNILDDFQAYSNFKLTEDNKYVAKIFVGSEANAENILIETNEDEKILSISYTYKKDDCKFSTTMTETMPEDANYDSLSATLDGDNLIVSFDRINVKKNPVKIEIKRV